MTKQQIIQLAKPRYVKKLVHYSVSLGCLIVLGTTVVVAILLVLWLTPFLNFLPENIALLMKILASVMFPVLLISPEIVFFVLMIVYIVIVNNKKFLFEKGYDIYRLKQRRAKRVAEKDYAEKREKEKVEQYKNADFDYNQELFYKTSYYVTSKVWIDTVNRVIQFYLPEYKETKGYYKELFFENIKMEKTKVISLNTFKDVQLIDITLDVEKTKGINSDLYGDKTSVPSAKKKTRLNYFYEVQITFKHEDCPIVRVYFHNNKNEAEELCQTIKLLDY